MAEQIKAGCLQPWEVKDLPEGPQRGFKNILKFIGPGAVMLSLSIGSGE